MSAFSGKPRRQYARMLATWARVRLPLGSRAASRIDESSAGSRHRLGVAEAHRGVVVAALKDGFDRSSTFSVSHFDRGAVWIGFPAIAPLHEGYDGDKKVEPFVGESVFVAFPLPRLAIGHATQDTRRHQSCESFAQQVASASDPALKLFESPRAVERFAKYQERPLFAHDLQRALHRAVLSVVAVPID